MAKLSSPDFSSFQLKKQPFLNSPVFLVKQAEMFKSAPICKTGGLDMSLSPPSVFFFSGLVALFLVFGTLELCKHEFESL